MKKNYHFLLMLLCLISTPLLAQTKYNYSMKGILKGASSGSVRLPDGTVVTVELIKTGSATIGSTMGKEGGNMGGFLDGVNNANAPSAVPNQNALTIAQYQGSKNPQLFSSISVDNLVGIHNGVNNRFQGSVGYYIHFSKPTNYSNFLFTDIDGELDNTPYGNREWSIAFGYNGNTFRMPDVTRSPNSHLRLTRAVNTGGTHSWRTLVADKLGQTAADNFPNSLTIVSLEEQQPSMDPDEIRNQYLASFPADQPVTDFFVLWGIIQQFETPLASGQRSNISPITVELSPDFGDAPDTYKTLLKADALLSGPSHGIVSGLKLGAIVNTENDGQPSTQANTAVDDDGVASFPELIQNKLYSSYSVNVNYTNETGKPAYLIAWLDINADGKFDSTEGVLNTISSGQTSGTVPVSWGPVAIDATQTYARFRISTEPMSTADIGGAFMDGEVEDYRISIVNIPLPVNLLSFVGKAGTEGIVLHWETAQEVNFSHFDIEKSTDGRRFNKMGTVNGSNQGRYQFFDSAPHAGLNYYRLKMVDSDGTSTQSRVIQVDFEGVVTYLTVENPTNDGYFQVITNASNPDFELYNSAGGKVPVTFSADRRSQKYTLRVNGQRAGLYILRMIDNDKVISRKIIMP